MTTQRRLYVYYLELINSKSMKILIQQKEWNARLLIERSSSVKCPSIAYHLAGTKKVQQVLALPEVLERYYTSIVIDWQHLFYRLIHDAKIIARLRESFIGLYSLTDGDPGVDDIVEKAKKDGSNFVMKPQREGGGNNIYGKKIEQGISIYIYSAKIDSVLREIKPEERSAYILMDRIHVPSFQTRMMRNDQLLEVNAVSELGIFSVFVRYFIVW